jgi:hypothetical protein
MNRKQRLLTVIALIAFVVIGACHYLAWPPLRLYGYKRVPLTVWKELTYEFPEEIFRVHTRQLTEAADSRQLTDCLMRWRELLDEAS